MFFPNKTYLCTRLKNNNILARYLSVGRVLGQPRKKQEYMKQKVSIPFMMMGILFNVCLITANLLATKLVHLWDSPDLDITVTAGLLVFPISYIINDCIVEVWGFKKAKLIIWSGFAMNFLVVILGLLATVLPPAPDWNGNEHFNYVFSFAPRVAAASLLGFLVGSFLNAMIMSKMKVASKGKNFAWRAIWSTIVGEIGDSIIFFTIAFTGVVPLQVMFYMMLTQVVLKTAYEIVILPITMRVVKKVKEIEGEDVYDESISYNVLTVKDL